VLLNFSFIVDPSPTLGQQLDSSAINKSKQPSQWILLAMALDLNAPNVGSPLNLFGFSANAGYRWNNRLLLFSTHNTGDNHQNQPTNEYRYDYAALFGYSNHNDILLSYLAGGVNYVNYQLRGEAIIPPSCRECDNGSYNTLTGKSVGVAAIAGFYITPIEYWGAVGLNLYYTYSKRIRYFALDFSFVNLNIPLPFWK
jgi:hypothetical protein